MSVDWIIIKDMGREIGAVGFIGNKASVVVSFYDDADGNMDGTVSTGEWIASKLSPISFDNHNVVSVAMAARLDMAVLRRDPSFGTMAMSLFMNFAHSAVMDGVYTVYFSRGVSMGAGGVTKKIFGDGVKAFAVKKGMESAVKEAFRASVH